MRFLRPLLVLLLGLPALAAPTPYSVASLVHEKDESVLTESLRAGMASPTPLVRAAAARVIAVRGVTALLPLLRDTVQTETDATAAREEIRALALIGAEEDFASASAAASRWPAGMDDALAVAVARRGGLPAIDSYVKTLRSTRMNNAAEFFRVALWARADLLPYTGSRLIGAGDTRGWRGLLDALRHSNVAMHPPVLATSLDTESEDIRAATLWYLVSGYASDPSTLPPLVAGKLAQPRGELSSDREDFARELLRRMTGGEKKNDPRWLRFLDTAEADRLFAGENDSLQYLTDQEYELRYKRCEVQTRECAMPPRRGKRTIPSEDVAPPAIDLPAVLPAGLADAIVQGARCNDTWLGVAHVTVDSSGRVHKLDVDGVGGRPACRRALDTLLRVSLATNTSIRSGFSDAVLLARSGRAPLCLDEDPPDQSMTALYRGGGAVQMPKVRKRVEPHFSESARKAMGRGANVIVIVEAVITKSGCVRSVRLVRQSPYPEVNGAAALAVSQWTFAPATLDGKPVDVLFNLTINFKVS